MCDIKNPVIIKRRPEGTGPPLISALTRMQDLPLESECKAADLG